jgi:bifunctional DNA-binding transcriptional regulator/antitoxin component of YhaV-PrlF toxin-antitoxin module
VDRIYIISLRTSVHLRPNMPIHSRRKVIDLGGSNSLTLPKNWTEGTSLRPGDVVEVYGNGVLVIVPPTTKLQQEEVMRLLNRFHLYEVYSRPGRTGNVA